MSDNEDFEPTPEGVANAKERMYGATLLVQCVLQGMVAEDSEFQKIQQELACQVVTDMVTSGDVAVGEYLLSVAKVAADLLNNACRVIASATGHESLGTNPQVVLKMYHDAVQEGYDEQLHALVEPEVPDDIAALLDSILAEAPSMESGEYDPMCDGDDAPVNHKHES